MKGTQQTPQSKPSSIKMLRAMVGIGLLCALLIVMTYESTKARIETLKSNALQEAIFKVIPGTVTTKSFQIDKKEGISEVKGKSTSKQSLYAGYDENGFLKGIAIEARGQGYADIISILYGYNPKEQTIVGFYVLESKETPGLGDKIEKDPNFLANFEAMDVALSEDKNALENAVITMKQGEKANPWEIDGITGATISSRAIGEIINKSASEILPLIQKNIDAFKGENENGESN